MEALVEEVEGGLLAGGSPLLADGSPLADEYGCDTREECDEKCNEIGGNPVAKRPACICVWDTRQEVFSCEYFGGGGKWPEVPGLGVVKIGDPNDPSRDPGRPGGTGGDDGDDDDDDEERELSFGCDEGVERGADGECEVKANFPMDSLEFSWVSGSNSSKGRGEGYASWEGTATEDRGVMVTILGKGDRAVLLVGGVTVSPRKWKLDTQEARSEPEWVDDIEGWPTAWGLYRGGLPSPEELKSTAQGSGPWEGTWILDGQPTITAAKMYYHNDLDSTGAGPEYQIVDTIDAKVIEECAVPDSVVDAGLVGVYALNDICGYSARVDAFRGKVIAHEERHETSLNECIGAVNNDGRMAAVEAIVGKTETAARDSAKVLWTKGVVVPLFNAKETAQGPESADIWKYRPGPWKYGLETKGHNGKDGCP